MSDQPKFTPGPWSLGPDRGKARRRIDGPLWGNLAKVVTRMSDQATECADGLANAHLIAAAPDLYALVDLVHGSFGGGLVVTFSEADVEEFRAALAKARGQA